MSESFRDVDADEKLQDENGGAETTSSAVPSSTNETTKSEGSMNNGTQGAGATSSLVGLFAPPSSSSDRSSSSSSIRGGSAPKPSSRKTAASSSTPSQHRRAQTSGTSNSNSTRTSSLSDLFAGPPPPSSPLRNAKGSILASAGSSSSFIPKPSRPYRSKSASNATNLTSSPTASTRPRTISSSSDLSSPRSDRGMVSPNNRSPGGGTSGSGSTKGSYDKSSNDLALPLLSGVESENAAVIPEDDDAGPDVDQAFRTHLAAHMAAQEQSGNSERTPLLSRERQQATTAMSTLAAPPFVSGSGRRIRSGSEDSSEGDYGGGSDHNSSYPTSPAVTATDITPKTGSATRKSHVRNRPSNMPPNLPSISERELQGSMMRGDEGEGEGQLHGETFGTGEGNDSFRRTEYFEHISGDEGTVRWWRRRPMQTYLIQPVKSMARASCAELLKPSFWIGSVMFLLFQVVFSLTLGAAIIRPHSNVSMLGLFTKMAALGVMFGAPVYWMRLGSIPALYPTVDLFVAPILANLAVMVDEKIYNDESIDEEKADLYFLTTFCTLVSVSLIMSGGMLVLASVFKLANLGSYLPFPVLAGFFAAVGVLTWTLAVTVDTNGKSVNTIITSGDWQVVSHAIVHHTPSVVVGAAMKILGPKNPFYVVGMVVATIVMFYVYMITTGTSRQDMIDDGWFWSSEDLVYTKMGTGVMGTSIGFAVWVVPAPLGWLHGLWQGQLHIGAFWSSLETAVALSFLYVIRCTLHGAALRKNVPNLQRVERVKDNPIAKSQKPHEPQHHYRNSSSCASNNGGGIATTGQGLVEALSARLAAPVHQRKFSEFVEVDMDHLRNEIASGQAGGGGGGGSGATISDETVVVRAKPTHLTLKEILLQYGYSQFMCAFVGSTPVTPSVAAAPTMYLLGAESVAPQLGSVILLSAFYLSDFKMVGYIPKPAFSSLLVLAFLDMIHTWFIKSYLKTKEKLEWLVVPAIVIFASVFNLLDAVFVGLAMSTFLFVASFFRSSVVKYMANGIIVRSTIERPVKVAKYLDQHGDLIQIFVLQNYLFFGNASSIQSYVVSMFEEPEEEIDPLFVPPIPKIIILDMTLVTGMDTSAVEIFSEILASACSHDCILFLAGVSTSMRQVMSLGGFKPEVRQRRNRRLRFFPNLDSAIGKAEDLLLEDEAFEQSISRENALEKGFPHALQHIDEQHDTTFKEDLLALSEFTKIIDLDVGSVLYEDQDLERGIFFIEHGIMKIERNSLMTMSRVGNEAFFRVSDNNGTLNALNARSPSIGQDIARMKAQSHNINAPSSHFRVARVGPGWVIGSIEALCGIQFPVHTIAVTPCRLHHISFREINEIEETNPLLILSLYKLLAYLMAKRQEITIGQLGTLHSIMSSPAQKKPVGRGTKRFGSFGAFT